MEEGFAVFVGLITQIYKSIQRIKSLEMTEQGLRANHTMCLHTLNRNPGGLTAAQLALRCEEDKAAISRTLVELMERGYLLCETAEGGKKYRAKIFLTEKGKAVAQFIGERAQSMTQQAGEGLSPRERENLYVALRLIAANLQTLQNKNGPAGRKNEKG